MHHWVKLAVRWWSKLRQRGADDAPSPDQSHSQQPDLQPASCIAFEAWKSDIQLMLDGCRRCWTCMLMHIMTRLGIVTASQCNGTNVTVAQVMATSLDPAAAAGALGTLLQHTWCDSVSSPAYSDPRTAPSNDLALCTHSR